MTAKCVMVLGTSSGAGKSWLTTALCRWYARQGLKVAPFKAQNMSNNARVVASATGLGEIGSAQYFQALAAHAEPDVRMNPLLLKPERDTHSQVVLMGQVDEALSRMAWRGRSASVWPVIAQALDDLRQAIALQPTHLSWYQLTLEPNTVFFREQPVLPDEDVLADIQDAGQALLAAEGYVQYEVSAYARRDQRCRHNLNYWQFGDYLGIGAGAHGKLTRITAAGIQILRTTKTRVPKDYLRATAYRVSTTTIAAAELPFEFMLNTLRLIEGVPAALWPARTGLSAQVLADTVTALQDKGLLQTDTDRLVTTALGQRYLNRVIEAFLPE